MKKLMIAVAIFCAAVVANAATYDWDATGAFYWNGETATGEELAGSTIYLFQGGSTEMNAMLSSLATTGTDALTGYLGSGEVDSYAGFSFQNASDAQKIADDGATPLAHINAYFIAVTEDGKFATGYAYTPIDATEGVVATGASFMPDWAVEMPAAGAAGWSTVAAPEPTSGLLLLIGMAGLALKRKRA